MDRLEVLLNMMLLRLEVSRRLLTLTKAHLESNRPIEGAALGATQVRRMLL